MRTWSLILSVLISGSAAAAEPTATRYPVHPLTLCSTDELLRMDECQLLDAFRRAAPGPIPNGYTPGRVITKPGKRTTVLASRFMKPIWQGKNFDCDGLMTNKIFGIKFIKGQVAQEASWIDGRSSNAIDYSQTSKLFKPYRDEFREVSPGIYLGIMFERTCPQPKIMTYFVLDARCK